MGPVVGEDGAPRRARRRWGALAVVMVVAVSLVAFGWVNTSQRYSGAGARQNLCADYYQLKYALLSSSVVSEGTIRFRMARVAREAQFASTDAQRDTLPARTAAEDVARLVQSPVATRTNVLTYLRPVAVACGDTYRVYLNFEPRPQEGVTAGL